MERGKRRVPWRERKEGLHVSVRNRNVRMVRGGEGVEYGMEGGEAKRVKTMKRKREGKHREGESDTGLEGS